jgi:hypothetical protein
VEQEFLFGLHVPSGHLYENSFGQIGRESIGKHFVIESTHAPFQHFIIPFPQEL